MLDFPHKYPSYISNIVTSTFSITLPVSYYDIASSIIRNNIVRSNMLTFNVFQPTYELNKVRYQCWIQCVVFFQEPKIDCILFLSSIWFPDQSNDDTSETVQLYRCWSAWSIYVNIGLQQWASHFAAHTPNKYVKIQHFILLICGNMWSVYIEK